MELWKSYFIIMKHKNLAVPLMVFLTLIYCECIIYFVVQFQCDWPELNSIGDSNNNLKVMFLADTHLLGPYRGHWFDKLRREWQMSMSFSTANYLHSPDVVFFLGDIFDEGEWVNKMEYEAYVQRFHSLFQTKKSHVIVGNHDVGFHHVMNHYGTLSRFYQSFNLSSSDILRIKGSTFITLNSMAMENDGCSVCKDAEKRIKSISKKLMPGERPFLLQHFPLYRVSDQSCNGEDAAPYEEKSIEFRPKIDCLSHSSSVWLLELLKPKAVFSGHTHHSCVYQHGPVVEYSVPSFSWRNRNNPSYLLVTFSNDDYQVGKCYMPRESSVILIYTCMAIVIVLVSVLQVFQKRAKRS